MIYLLWEACRWQHPLSQLRPSSPTTSFFRQFSMWSQATPVTFGIRAVMILVGRWSSNRLNWRSCSRFERCFWQQHKIKVRCIVLANLVGGRRFVQKAIQHRGKLLIYQQLFIVGLPIQKFASRPPRFFHMPRSRRKSYNWSCWRIVGGRMFLILNGYVLEQMLVRNAFD